MKLDVIIYSKTTAIGLFWFAKWYDTPLVMFIYKANNYPGNHSDEWDSNILENIKSLAEISEMDETIVQHMEAAVDVCELIPPELFKSVATIYSKMNMKTEDFYNRKVVLTDLVKCCPVETSRAITDLLEKSKKEEEREDAFKCVKVLAEELNYAFAYHQLAYYYQEGIGVEKNIELVYPNMKKAAELGEESALKWLKKYDKKL